MPKHRSLDGEFWTDPKLRKLPWHARMLLAALVGELADDEGRFEIELEGWLDVLFARKDPVTEDDLRADVAALSDERLGIIEVYGDGQYGRLTAWYKRQIIRNPAPSTLPAPPDDGCSITSWAAMDALCRAYIAERGGDQGKTWNTTVARWWDSLAPEERLEFIEKRKVPFFTVLYREEPPDVKVREKTNVQRLTAACAREATNLPTEKAPPPRKDSRKRATESTPSNDDMMLLQEAAGLVGRSKLGVSDEQDLRVLHELDPSEASAAVQELRDIVEATEGDEKRKDLTEEERVRYLRKVITTKTAQAEKRAEEQKKAGRVISDLEGIKI